MRLVHFSSIPIKKVTSKKQTGPGIKPVGLWLSVEGNGDGWKDWCEAENFSVCPGAFDFEYRVQLTDSANILFIQSNSDLDKFTETYKHRLAKSSKNFTSVTLYDTGTWIDWKRVTQSYQGIVITPYLWQRRLGSRSVWYYAWDCASGCIWDADAIKSIKLLAQKKAA